MRQSDKSYFIRPGYLSPDTFGSNPFHFSESCEDPFKCEVTDD